MEDESKKWLFAHVPKCAGNSFNPNPYPYFYHGHDTNTKDFKFLKDINHHDYDFIFTFVRNPWDRLVSSFHYLKQGGNCKNDALDFEKYLSKYKSFRDLVLNWDDSLFNQIHFRPQHEWICDHDGGLIPHFIGRLETIQKDWDFICNKMNVPIRNLPFRNKSQHKYYTEYYNDETRQIVAEKYVKDIEYFGYQFK